MEPDNKIPDFQTSLIRKLLPLIAHQNERVKQAKIERRGKVKWHEQEKAQQNYNIERSYARACQVTLGLLQGKTLLECEPNHGNSLYKMYKTPNATMIVHILQGLGASDDYNMLFQWYYSFSGTMYRFVHQWLTKPGSRMYISGPSMISIQSPVVNNESQ